MADPENGAQSGTDPAQSGQENNQGTGTTGTGTTDDSATQSGGAETNSGSTGATVSAEEMERQRERTRAADQRASKLEAELKQIRDKDLPEAEKIKRDLEEANAEREKLREDLKQNRLETAFLKDNKYKWKNPSTALKLADLTNVEVEDDGKVTGLTAALDALAKAEPYLIDADGSGDGDGNGQQQRGSTGATGTGGRQANQTGTDLKKAAIRIPALRSRGLGNS